MNTKRERQTKNGWALLAAWVGLNAITFARLGCWLGFAMLPINFALIVFVAPAIIGFVAGFLGYDIFSDQQ